MVADQEILEEEVNVDLEGEGEVDTDVQENLDLDGLDDRKIGEKYEKPNMDGEEVTIAKIELTSTAEIRKTLDGKKRYKDVMFKVYYDEETYENYGGVTQFRNKDGVWGSPNIWVEGKSASAKLFRLWVKHQGGTAEDYSFKAFFKGLTGMKGVLKNKTVDYQGEDFTKNVIEQFL